MLIQTYNGMGEPAEVYEGTITSYFEHKDGVWATASVHLFDGRQLPGVFVRLSDVRPTYQAAE